MTRAAPERHGIRPALVANAVPIDDLTPHPLNDRHRSPKAKAAIRDSLETNGQYRSVVARRLPDGTVQLLAGHGTIEQARELGWTHAAAEIHDNVPDDEAARIVAVDNRTSDLADYVDERRLALLEAMGNLKGSGYDLADLAEIRARVDAINKRRALTDVDAAPKPPAKPHSRTGQTWLLGPHRLVVGDGTDPDVVRHALAGDQADAYITDPPYGVDYHGTAGTLEGDGRDTDALAQLLGGLFTAALANTRPGGPVYVFHSDHAADVFHGTLKDSGWFFHQVIIWVKDRFVLGRKDYHTQHEPILYGWAPGAAHSWHGTRSVSTVIEHPNPRANKVHPTMKPVDLLGTLVTNSTRQGALLLDTCAGSGSLAIACHHTGRRAALVELDPRFADVICRRWAEHTGVDAVLEDTGQTFGAGRKAS